MANLLDSSFGLLPLIEHLTKTAKSATVIMPLDSLVKRNPINKPGRTKAPITIEGLAEEEAIATLIAGNAPIKTIAKRLNLTDSQARYKLYKYRKRLGLTAKGKPGRHISLRRIALTSRVDELLAQHKPLRFIRDITGLSIAVITSIRDRAKE